MRLFCFIFSFIACCSIFLGVQWMFMAPLFCCYCLRQTIFGMWCDIKHDLLTHKTVLLTVHTYIQIERIWNCIGHYCRLCESISVELRGHNRQAKTKPQRQMDVWQWQWCEFWLALWHWFFFDLNRMATDLIAKMHIQWMLSHRSIIYFMCIPLCTFRRQV